MNHSEEELHRDLDRGAGVFEARGGRERTMAEVLGTARSIRRRRRAGAGLVAAAVLAAIAVPVGLSSAHRSAAPPLPASSVTPQPIQRLGLRDLPVGAPPGTGWVEAGSWHAGDGSVLPVPPRVGEVRAAAPTDGGVVVSADDGAGWLDAWYLPEHGPATRLGPVEGGLARSRDGHVVAWSRPGVSPAYLRDGHRPLQVLPAPATGTGFDLVAVTDDVRAYLRSIGVGAPTSWATGTLPGGLRSERLAGIASIADVAPDGRRTGIVSATDSGTCSQVQDAGGGKVWGTCAARLVAFSPDGARLLGTSAYGDGLGDTQLTVFDAASGATALDLRTVRGAVITQMTWEDDSHLLAVVLQRQRAAVVRIGVDGRAEYAVPPVAAAEGSSPFVLPVS